MLELVGGNEVGINFIEVDASSKQGNIADVWTYRPFKKPFQLKAFGKVFVVADSVHQRINCDSWTVEKKSIDGYDETGTRVIFLPPAPSTNIRPRTDEDLLAGVFCKNVAIPPQNRIVGYMSARTMARYMFEHPTP